MESPPGEMRGLFLFHSGNVDAGQLRETVIERSNSLGSSESGIAWVRPRSHPLLVMSRPLRSRTVVRLVAGEDPGEGPSQEPYWDAMETHLFDGRSSTDAEILADKTHRAGRVAGRAFRIVGSGPQDGETVLFFTLRRRDGLSRREMQRIWLEEHSEIVVSGAAAIGFNTYVQVHNEDDPSAGSALDTDVDALGLLSFSSTARMALKSMTPGATRVNLSLIRDEPRFVYPPATTLALATYEAI